MKTSAATEFPNVIFAEERGWLSLDPALGKAEVMTRQRLASTTVYDALFITTILAGIAAMLCFVLGFVWSGGQRELSFGAVIVAVMLSIVSGTALLVAQRSEDKLSATIDQWVRAGEALPVALADGYFIAPDVSPEEMYAALRALDSAKRMAKKVRKARRRQGTGKVSNEVQESIEAAAHEVQVLRVNARQWLDPEATYTKRWLTDPKL